MQSLGAVTENIRGLINTLLFPQLMVDNLQPEIQNIAQHLNHEVAVRAKQLGWSKRVAREERRGRDRNISWKVKGSVPGGQPREWVVHTDDKIISKAGFSVQEQLATGGVLWFPDLTALDSTWILPICIGAINLIIVEIVALQKSRMSRFQTGVTYFVRGISVLMIPIAATVPSSLVLYWLCSSFMGLSQNLLLRSPRFRQFCRIPLTKGDSDTPYKDLFAAFYAKYISRK
ncbi:PREDICTED: mitochondrial inner membrane protein COX18 [Myotis brandtii]|uniref:mitochondrial inner membrane protein COX18 n=1 Tax=Myotis brandtii TaxID=109478 RepID=UPI000703E371|nr:PREDICTED: mitochondrial inner membrane protein COX18 [Myotis brandtii]